MVAETSSFDYAGLPLGNRTSFGYEAVDDNRGKRKVRSSRVQQEDAVLSQRKREQLTASMHDAIRNFQIVSWMCRKHLDYVTTFSFKAKVKDNDDFNKELEAFIDRKTNRHNFHVSRRHPLRRFLRIAEGRRVLDGDFGMLKVGGATNRRGKVQGIESDLIKDPPKPKVKDDERWINGVKIGPITGESLAYGLHRRKLGKTVSSTEYVKQVSSRHMYLHANYDSTFRHDQVRGTSAFAATWATLQDGHEILGYEKTRHKIARMFGLVLKSDDENQTFIESLTADNDGATVKLPKTDLEEGRLILDLKENDDAKFLENKTNVEETVALLRFLMQMACLALDLPISMLDERDTTFFGGRGALVQYIHGCNAKRNDVKDLLNDWGQWQIGLGVLDGELELPPGLDFDDIKYEWRPCGIPWWDPVKEVNGYGQAVAACFTNFDAVIQEVYGGRSTVEENIRENAKAFKLAEELKFPIRLPGGANLAEKPSNESKPDNDTDKKEGADDGDRDD